MSENIKVRWLTDHEQTKIAPKTLSTQIMNEDGTRFKDTVESAIVNAEAQTTAHASNNDIHVTAEEKEAWNSIEVPSLDGYATEEYVESLVKKLSATLALSFYCIEEVTVITNGVSKVYPANSNVEIVFSDEDVFEIVPTSNESILSLTAFPGALGTFYPWLEGVAQFSNILFDMNDVDFYSKWSQGNQGAYHVQKAQYTNCIFWSDNPYVSDVSKRTNYTLTHTSQLPLCYSSIPDNTFKSFYLAFGVNSDPNWGNRAYLDSFAKATWATQVFSYYGARTIGIVGHDNPDFNIVLPKDCRGLMFDARHIENAGTFDAINCTNFGAKSGSWREAFGFCPSLKRLYIKNLKVNLNISWSPIDYDSISYIISAAANTSAITISVSPYTYNLLSPADFTAAANKNITIALITTNYVEDRRLSTIADKADKVEALLKTAQTLTDEELAQVRKNLKFIGKDLEGQTFTIDGTEYTASANAEIFGDYTSNIAVGQWSIAEGSGTVAKGRASHAEGAYSQALQDGCHVEGYQTKATGYWSHAEGEMTVVSSYASHAEGSYCTLPDGTKRYGTASGYASHVEGGGCHTTGSCTHAEGLATTASGAQSHVEGRYTIAAGGAQHVEGIANIEDTNGDYIHIAGNGAFDARSNAYTLDWDGNAWFSGDVYVGSTSGTNKDEGSKKLATEEYVQEHAVGSPNWAASAGESGYIENRTHYEEENIKTLFDGTYIRRSLSTGASVKLAENLTVGAKYTVVLNGVSYELIAYVSDDCVCVGAPYDEDVGDYDLSTIPFNIYCIDEVDREYEIWEGAPTIGIVGESTLVISGIETIVHQLDEKFIPTTVARVSDLTGYATEDFVRDVNNLPMDDIFDAILARLPRAEEAEF